MLIEIYIIFFPLRTFFDTILICRTTFIGLLMSVSMKIMGCARERYQFYELESCLLLTQDRTLDFLSNVIYIIALSRRFSIFGYMISQPVGCFLINRLKEDIAARLDLIKSNSCLSGWCIRGQDALRHVTFQGG